MFKECSCSRPPLRHTFFQDAHRWWGALFWKVVSRLHILEAMHILKHFILLSGWTCSKSAHFHGPRWDNHFDGAHSVERVSLLTGGHFQTMHIFTNLVGPPILHLLKNTPFDNVHQPLWHVSLFTLSTMYEEFIFCCNHTFLFSIKCNCIFLISQA